jgi:hypothetical protein
MAKQIFLVCCKTAIVDSLTNQLSILNLIEEIKSPKFPAILTEAHIVAYIQKEENDSQTLDLEITVGQNQKVIVKQSVQINFGDGLRNRLILNFPLFVPGPGEIEISVKGLSGASFVIPVATSEVPSPSVFSPSFVSNAPHKKTAGENAIVGSSQPKMARKAKKKPPIKKK